MSVRQVVFSQRGWRALQLGLYCLCVVGWLTPEDSFGDPPVSISKIEEDWQLVVDLPDPNSSGPQITCSIAPVAGDESLYAAFELNHRTQPVFEKGGLQLQAWSHSFNLANNPYPQNQLLSTSGETVRWTMSMHLAGDSLTFEVKNGSSTTWGNFGGQGYLKTTQTCDLSNLNQYSADESAENSGIGFASNRVQSLTLLRVRYFTSDGQVFVDDQPRVVHQLQ